MKSGEVLHAVRHEGHTFFDQRGVIQLVKVFRCKTVLAHFLLTVDVFADQFFALGFG